MKIHMLILIVSTLLQMGCVSYFQRKDCEAKNWFDYGQKMALSGKTLEEDNYLLQCRKVEANISHTQLDLGYKAGKNKYCSEAGAFQTGRAGNVINYTLCDSISLNRLKSQYERGLTEFCTKSSGYDYGAKGNIYQNVCPQSLEADFLVEYKRGRKIYLTALVNEKERKIQSLERTINNYMRQKDSLMIQLALVPQPLDQQDKNYSLRTNIESDIRSVQSRISSSQQEKEQVENEVMSLRTELATLH